MLNSSSSALGLIGMRSFQTKAEALQYAIDFTATRTEEGLKVNYEAAKEMFDFICKNVKLPETKSESLDVFMSKLSDFHDSLYKRLDSIKEKEYPATPEECGPSEVPPARPLDEAPDFMADGPVVNPTGPFNAE